LRRGQRLPPDQPDGGPLAADLTARAAASTVASSRRASDPPGAWSVFTRGPTRAQSAGSVGPKSASVGAPTAAARCETPASLPRKTPAPASAAPRSRSGQSRASTASDGASTLG